MKRYWVPKDWINGETVLLEGEIFHHIHHVCRNEVGSKFEILCGDQKAYFVELTSATKKRGEATIKEVRDIRPLEKPFLRLALSLPRFHKFDFIAEKAVEMGVASMHPFVSDYSFVRKIDSSLEKKRQRWEKIVQGATQQSGRGDLMPIHPATTLDQLLEGFNQDQGCLGLFPYEGECQLSIKDAIGQIRQDFQSNDLSDVWLFVGSEGGFSSQEVEKFQRVGLQPTTLGDRVLRVDTACMALVAILKYELGLWEGK